MFDETKDLVVVSVVENALAKENVTALVISELKEKYLPLTIQGIDDKEGYRKVKEARIECKNLRILAEKITKKGREKAIAEQKAWIAKEKEVVNEISSVEDYLQSQQDAIDNELERLKEEERAKENAWIQERIDKLAQYNVVIDLFTVKTMPDDMFEQKLEEGRIAHEAEIERVKKEEEEKKQEEERVLRMKEEAEKKEAELREIERKQNEEREKLEAERIAFEKQKQDEVDRIEREKEIERLRKEAEEKAKIEAEEKLRKENEERERLENEKRIAEEKRKALMPDMDKLRDFANSIDALVKPELSSDESKTCLSHALNYLNQATGVIRSWQ